MYYGRMIWKHDTNGKYGVIDIEVTRKSVRRLNMRVREDGTVAVSAPRLLSDERIRRFISDNNGWIVRRLDKNGRYHTKEEKKMLSVGGKVRYLGNEYKRIDVVGAPKVDIVGDLFAVFAPESKHDTVLKKWWRERARELFQADLDRLYQEIFLPLGVKKPDLTVKNMTSRWGSCNHVKCHINMNENLIKADAECVEYVVLHELTHLLYPNHGALFYAFLSKHMPTYRAREKRLKEVDKI